jgi:hypothetical protein
MDEWTEEKQPDSPTNGKIQTDRWPGPLTVSQTGQ